ncbi:MAG: hypothetical protein P4M14_07740 [Gammaproteobacteria bacterium]|nr:hypothetical protein [Gammaproteobacteria bacterium]
MLSSQIVQYDPLVSDTACHTRAPYLIYLARKTKAAELSQEEKNYLAACETLTSARSQKRDAFDIITEERTDSSKIPARYIPKESSNTKKNTFLAQQKTLVAKATIAFLQDNCQEMVLEGPPESYTFNIPQCKLQIPVLPLYVSAKMMLYSAASQNIPLVVNIKRLKLQEENFQLEGASSLVYAFDSEKKRFASQDASDDQEAIAIDMVSCHIPNTEDEVNGFLTAETFSIFLEAFKKEDIALLVMIAAAGHPQYPVSAEPPKMANPKVSDKSSGSAASSSAAASSPAVEEKLAAPVSINLNECSTKEFQQLTNLARQYGFFRENAQYIRISKDGVLSRTKTCIPFFIDHIRASTVNTAKLATATLHELRDNLREPKETLLEGFKKK